MKNLAAFRPFSERPRTLTAYKGWAFRSQTEARWAAFFDLIGQPYDYETVGYPVHGGAQWCVPDFVIPEPDGRVHIVDVKGTLIATDKAHERRGWLCDLS